MLKVTFVLGVVLALFVVESSCQNLILPTFRPPVPKKRPNFILPTYRPPLHRPVIRLAREAGPGDLLAPKEDMTILVPMNINSDRTVRSLDSPSVKRGGGSHPTSRGNSNTGVAHPGYNRRNARSLDSPSAKRGGGRPGTSSSSRDTGPTHPGNNRRNAREIRLPGHLNPLRPKPLYPRPTFPAPVPRIPILARTARDIQISGVEKPTHRDVIIPNWNPNVKTNPWSRIGGRRGRSLDLTNTALELVPHEREARDTHISGLPEFKKPSYRDVVIPNWNPHVRTDPWKSLGGRQH